MSARILLLTGPTASGKTAAAVELACRYGAALVSADAMLVYRGMDIGTAKPPSVVLRRYPHACVDVRDPHEPFNAADFVAEVARVASEHDRVVVVGGTPFYLSALVQPLHPLPSGDPALRAALEARDDLHEALRAVDPLSAARLHPNDRVRLVRALEVFALTGKPLSAHHAEPPPAPFQIGGVAFLDWPADVLDARIDARLQRMMDRGYLDEVRRLLEAGVGPELKPMRSLGYRHLAEHLLGGLDLAEAVRRTSRDTRRFARKQRTWARNLGWTPTDRAGVRLLAEAIFGSTKRP